MPTDQIAYRSQANRFQYHWVCCRIVWYHPQFYVRIDGIQNVIIHGTADKEKRWYKDAALWDSTENYEPITGACYYQNV